MLNSFGVCVFVFYFIFWQIYPLVSFDQGNMNFTFFPVSLSLLMREKRQLGVEAVECLGQRSETFQVMCGKLLESLVWFRR